MRNHVLEIHLLVLKACRFVKHTACSKPMRPLTVGMLSLGGSSTSAAQL